VSPDHGFVSEFMREFMREFESVELRCRLYSLLDSIEYMPKIKVTRTSQTSETSSGTYFNEQACHEHAL